MRDCGERLESRKFKFQKDDLVRVSDYRGPHIGFVYDRHYHTPTRMNRYSVVGLEYYVMENAIEMICQKENDDE